MECRLCSTESTLASFPVQGWIGLEYTHTHINTRIKPSVCENTHYVCVCCSCTKQIKESAYYSPYVAQPACKLILEKNTLLVLTIREVPLILGHSVTQEIINIYIYHIIFISTICTYYVCVCCSCTKQIKESAYYSYSPTSLQINFGKKHAPLLPWCSFQGSADTLIPLFSCLVLTIREVPLIRKKLGHSVSFDPRNYQYLYIISYYIYWYIYIYIFSRLYVHIMFVFAVAVLSRLRNLLITVHM